MLVFDVVVVCAVGFTGSLSSLGNVVLLHEKQCVWLSSYTCFASELPHSSQASFIWTLFLLYQDLGLSFEFSMSVSVVSSIRTTRNSLPLGTMYLVAVRP